MANVARSYAVGATVYVWYHDSPTIQYTPQSRVLADVKVYNSANDATISFTNGKSVDDTIAIPRVFTTQAACATAIINKVITDTAATVVLEGGADTTLVRTT